MLTYSLIPAQDAPETLWQDAEALRARCPGREDPLFSPQLARILSGIRRDTQLILARSGDRLMGFWPIHLRPGAWARPIGGPFSDWHAPLIDPDCPIGATDLMGAAGLSGMTVSSYLPAPGETCRTGGRVGAHISVITGDVEAWFENQRRLHSRYFKKMRQKRKHVERDHDTVEFNLDDQSDATFNTILELKRAQYAATGRHDVLAPSWAQDFVHALRANRQPGLHLRTASLYLDGRFAAGEIMICSETVAHGWLTAYDTHFGSYSPGLLLVEDILTDLPTRGQTAYDSGPGQDHYKKYYSNVMIPSDQGVLRTHKAALAPTRLLGNGWRQLENALPGHTGELMGKVRRRADQILVSESGSIDRARGFARAASHRAEA